MNVTLTIDVIIPRDPPELGSFKFTEDVEVPFVRIFNDEPLIAVMARIRDRIKSEFVID